MMGLFDQAGRTALLTGSSRGLGRAMAEGLAPPWCSTARMLGRLTATAAAMRVAGHTIHEALFDVTNEAAVIAAFAALDSKGIAVDILVNNAGIHPASRCSTSPRPIDSACWTPIFPSGLRHSHIFGPGTFSLSRGRERAGVRVRGRVQSVQRVE